MTAGPSALDDVIQGMRMTISAYPKGNPMNQIIYIVGAVVIVLALLSFVGMR